MRRRGCFQRWLFGRVVVCLFLGSFSCSPVWGQDSKPILDTSESTPPLLPTLLASPEVRSGILTIRFHWAGEKIPALAVIKSHGKWLIVFDESATVSVPDLKEHATFGVKGVDIVPTNGGGVVLQVMVEPTVTPVVHLDNDGWRISFKHQPFTLQQQASVQLPKFPKDGLVVGLEAPGKEVRFIDPHTGYTYIVFPSYHVGLGVAEESVFAEFHVMATTQGVAFQVLRDDMALAATSEKVTITHPDGLAITLPQDREQVRTKAMPMGIFVDAQDVDWVDRRQSINEELLDLPHSQHGPKELELAWLLLSNGQALEALGYLTHLAQERPSITNVLLFQTLQGIGNLLLHRFGESEHYLLSVGEEPEIQVWLSVIKVIRNPHYLTMSPTLLSQFRTQLLIAKPLLQSYPKPLRNQMSSLILLAGIALKDLEVLTSILDQEMRPENVREAEVFDLASAKVLMHQNKPDAALQMLGELMEKAVSPQVRAIARFDYVVHRWETHLMRKEEAYLELERIRSQCREGWLGQEITAYLEKREAEKATTE